MSPAMSPDREDLLAALGALPPTDPLDDLAIERVRRLSQAALAEEKRLAAWPAFARPLRTAWTRAVMPALVTAAVGSYLVWAIEATANLYR